MKVHTSDFKSQLTELGRELRGVITYNDVTLEDEINSITPHYEADILKSVMKQLDLELTVDIPLNTVINCQIGILVNGNYEMLNYGNYVVYNSEKQEDTNTYKITCYDKLLYSMKQNEDLGVTYPISIKNYLNAVASKIGLTVASGTFYNQDLQIPSELYLGQEYTYRDILDEIAQATGSIICLNENDEILVKYPTITGDTIDEDYLKDINVDFGQKYGVINSIVLSRAGESDNVYLQDEQSVEQNGLTEVKIVDNQIMNFNNRSDYLQGLLAALDGLYYYLNDFNSTGILYYEVGDLYNVQIGENSYQCLMLNDEINVTTGIEEIIHTDMPEKSETDYSKADKTDMRINKTYLIVDKQNQQIESVVNNVTEQNNKISQITQTVDEINSKISDIADITTYGESSFAEVELTEINESEPIMLKVHSTVVSPVHIISYNYPTDVAFPDKLINFTGSDIVHYMKDRIIRFTNTTIYQLTKDLRYNNFREYYNYDVTNNKYILLIAGTDYTIGDAISGNIYENLYVDYTLPDDLLYYNKKIYDEFYLDYESQTCQVIKRCEYDAYYNVKTLQNEIVIDYPYPSIILPEGDYRITLPGYEQGYIYVRLMAKNIYTKQFYTKVETNSIIDQKADEINLGVSQTLTNYSTTNEMNSAITLKANEITSTVSNTYETKNNAQSNYSQLQQTANNISSVVSTKVGEDEVISKINQSSEAVTIDANKINLNGKTINLTGDNIKISSTNFNVDKNGNMTCKNANVTGTINSSSGKIGAFKIGSSSLTSDDGSTGAHMNLDANQITFSKRSGSSVYNLGKISVFSSNTEVNFLRSDGNKSKLYADTIYAYDYETLSLAEKKKNFKKFENALDVIKNTDIYKYNLKNEDDNAKKHIGFVIGDDFNYSKEITTENNDGAELYSFVSVCCQAIKEQQEQIEQMKKEIKELKGGK